MHLHSKSWNIHERRENLHICMGKSSKCAHWKYKISGCRNLKNWLHWQIGQETKGWNARYRDNEYFIVENWNQILRVSSLNSNSYFCVWRFFGRFSRGGGRCCRGRAAFVGPILFENDNAHDVADIYIYLFMYIFCERGGVRVRVSLGYWYLFTQSVFNKQQIRGVAVVASLSFNFSSDGRSQTDFHSSRHRSRIKI